MTFRFATQEDCALLAELNFQLIEDERHRVRRSKAELIERMSGWLRTEYKAVLFEAAGGIVGYALFRPQEDEIYLRQLFIARGQRRKGLGLKAISILREKVWPKDTRLTVDVLVTNQEALAFWRAVGYRDYCITLECMPESKPA